MAEIKNSLYTNFQLANEIEDQYQSHLDLQNFCTVNNTLQGTAGMEYRVNRYSAITDDHYTAPAEGETAYTDWRGGNDQATEELAVGSGNSKTIVVQYVPYAYHIILGQNRFAYNDEQYMADPQVQVVGVRHMSTDLFNFVNRYIFAEFNKGTQVLNASALDFGAFADAVAMLNIENIDNDPQQVAPLCFAFVNPSDMATIRKNLKDDLKYVEAFSRTGYVGTAAGVNLYTKKDAVQGTVVLATREAVTLFNKRGVETEQLRDPDTRTNTMWSRKYFVAALTDDTKLVRIVLGGSSSGGGEQTPASVSAKAGKASK